MSRFAKGFLCLFGCILLFSILALAQITACIRGTVADPSGAVVPQAQLTCTNEDTGLSQKATTDSSGVYTFTLLPVGTYKLTVAASGFKTFEQRGITLTTNQVLGLNVTLQLGQDAEGGGYSSGAHCQHPNK
jgi:hypothetical protein